MSVINIVLLISSYILNIKPNILPSFYNIKNNIKNNNINMIDDSNLFNISDEILGLKLFTATETKHLTIKWLYNIINDDIIHPDFVMDDIVSTLTYSIKTPDKYDLYIAYMPYRFDEEPQFIGYLSIIPDKKILSIQQICTNPLNKDASFTKFKNSISILAKNSNVYLSPKPLKFILNPRYYLEFTQSF